MIDRNLYLAYVHLYRKLSSKLKITGAPVLNEDGKIIAFSVNLYADPHPDECTAHFGLDESGYSLIIHLEDISVNTWCKRICSATFDDENYGKIYDIVIEQITSAVKSGWINLDKCHAKLIDDLVEADLVRIETVKTYKLMG